MYNVIVIHGDSSLHLWEGILPGIPRIGEAITIDDIHYKDKKGYHEALKHMILVLHSDKTEDYREREYMERLDTPGYEILGMEVHNIVYDIDKDGKLVVEIYIGD